MMDYSCTAPVCLLLSVAFGESSNCPAQTRQPRELSVYEHTSDSWPMFAVLESDGDLRDSAGNVVPTGVTVPGGMFIFVTGKDGESENVLICGLNGVGAGVVEHWKRTLPAGFFQPQGKPMSFSDGQQDFIGVSYIEDTGRIYLLDRLSKCILENSWSGSGQLPCEGWVPWATPDMVSELINTDKYQLVVRKRPDPPSPRLALAKYGSWTEAPLPIFMRYDQRLGFQSEVGSVSDTARDVCIDRLSLREGGSTLEVLGGPGQIEVVDVSDFSVIGTATIPASGSIVVSLSRSLQVGNRYFARRPGVAAKLDLDSVPCPVRHGYGERLSSGATLGGMHYPLSCKIGSSAISYLSTSKGLLEDGSESLTGCMAIALRGQFGHDPVIQVDDNWLLDTIYYINVAGYASRSSGRLAGHFQIPYDPALIDAVLLTQFWVQDGNTYRLSQIVGAKIGGLEFLRATSGDGSRASNFPLDRKFKMKTGGDAIITQILKQRARFK